MWLKRLLAGLKLEEWRMHSTSIPLGSPSCALANPLLTSAHDYQIIVYFGPFGGASKEIAGIGGWAEDTSWRASMNESFLTQWYSCILAFSCQIYVQSEYKSTINLPVAIPESQLVHAAVSPFKISRSDEEDLEPLPPHQLEQLENKAACGDERVKAAVINKWKHGAYGDAPWTQYSINPLERNVEIMIICQYDFPGLTLQHEPAYEQCGADHNGGGYYSYGDSGHKRQASQSGQQQQPSKQRRTLQGSQGSGGNEEDGNGAPPPSPPHRPPREGAIGKAPGEPKYKCPFEHKCKSKPFASDEFLRDHIMKFHSVCPVCVEIARIRGNELLDLKKAGFGDYLGMRNHLQRKHVKALCCPDCPERYGLLNILTRHVFDQHIKPKDGQNGPTPQVSRKGMKVKTVFKPGFEKIFHRVEELKDIDSLKRYLEENDKEVLRMIIPSEIQNVLEISKDVNEATSSSDTPLPVSPIELHPSPSEAHQDSRLSSTKHITERRTHYYPGKTKTIKRGLGFLPSHHRFGEDPGGGGSSSSDGSGSVGEPVQPNQEEILQKHQAKEMVSYLEECSKKDPELQRVLELRFSSGKSPARTKEKRAHAAISVTDQSSSHSPNLGQGALVNTETTQQRFARQVKHRPVAPGPSKVESKNSRFHQTQSSVPPAVILPPPPPAYPASDIHHPDHFLQSLAHNSNAVSNSQLNYMNSDMQASNGLSDNNFPQFQYTIGQPVEGLHQSFSFLDPYGEQQMEYGTVDPSLTVKAKTDSGIGSMGTSRQHALEGWELDDDTRLEA